MILPAGRYHIGIRNIVRTILVISLRDYLTDLVIALRENDLLTVVLNELSRSLVSVPDDRVCAYTVGVCITCCEQNKVSTVVVVELELDRRSVACNCDCLISGEPLIMPIVLRVVQSNSCCCVRCRTIDGNRTDVLRTVIACSPT